MSHPVDSLFKSKLEPYANPAPGRAWARVQSGLNPSSRKQFWLKVAAGIALFATASALVVNLLPADEQPVAKQYTERNTPHSNTPPPQPQQTVTAVVVPVTEPTRAQPEVSVKPEQLAKAEAPVHNEIAVEPAEIAVVQEDVILQPATGLVIVMRAEEVNAKYLLPATPAEATVEHKKSSRLQKLAGMAHNLGNEDILGDLRDRKNELFAFHFLNDKKEKKN